MRKSDAAWLWSRIGYYSANVLLALLFCILGCFAFLYCIVRDEGHMPTYLLAAAACSVILEAALLKVCVMRICRAVPSEWIQRGGYVDDAVCICEEVVKKTESKRATALRTLFGIAGVLSCTCVLYTTCQAYLHAAKIRERNRAAVQSVFHDLIGAFSSGLDDVYTDNIESSAPYDIIGYCQGGSVKVSVSQNGTVNSILYFVPVAGKKDDTEAMRQVENTMHRLSSAVALSHTIPQALKREAVVPEPCRHKILSLEPDGVFPSVYPIFTNGDVSAVCKYYRHGKLDNSFSGGVVEVLVRAKDRWGIPRIPW